MDDEVEDLRRRVSIRKNDIYFHSLIIGWCSTHCTNSFLLGTMAMCIREKKSPPELVLFTVLSCWQSWLFFIAGLVLGLGSLGLKGWVWYLKDAGPLGLIESRFKLILTSCYLLGKNLIMGMYRD